MLPILPSYFAYYYNEEQHQFCCVSFSLTLMRVFQHRYVEENIQFTLYWLFLANLHTAGLRKTFCIS